MKEKIACSAIYFDDGVRRVHQPKNIETGIVICGLRHCNCFAILAELFRDLRYKVNAVQGFLTTENRFVDRVVAMDIAFNAGQLRVRDGVGDELCSEHLY